jgi:large subunit ribosomal protein L25
LNEIEVSALPADLPEFIEVDMAEVDLGDVIHLSDLTFPSGVTSTALALGGDRDMAVAAVLAPKGVKGDSDEDTAEAAGDETGEEDGAES